MAHSDWFNKVSPTKGKRIEVIKKGIRTYEWIDVDQPVVEKPEPADEPATPQHKAKAPNASDKFHKAHCEKCDNETWHFRESGFKQAYCTDCTKPKQELVKDAIAVVAQLMPTVERPTEAQVLAQNKLDRSLWRNAEAFSTRVFADDVEVPGIERAPTLPPNVNQNICTFCKSPIDKINTTYERKPKISILREAHKVGDEIVIDEKVIVKTEDIHACPNCVAKVRKPIVVRRV